MAGLKRTQPGTLRLTLPITVAALSVFMLALPNPADAQSFDGPWCGRSGQDIEVSFTVEGNRIVEANFGATVSLDNGCSTSVWIDGAFSEPVTNGSFSLVSLLFGFDLILEGTFQSPETAAGTVSLRVFDSVDCDGTSESPWNATPGVCEPLLQVDPLTWNFGETPVGTSSAPRRITVANEGTGDLRFLRRIRLAGADSGQFSLPILNSCRFETLSPDESCALEVSYRPTSTGPHSATVLIQPNHPELSDVEVQLLGIGVPPPSTLSPDTSRRRFGEVAVGQAAPPRKVVLTNHGTRTVRLDAVRIFGTDRAQFTLADDRCSSRVLPPGRACQFRVGFEPTAIGDQRALAVIRSDDPEASEIRVQLRGTGIAPGVAVEPDLVLVNAEVLTMDAFDTVASAVRIRDGRIVAIGDDIGPLEGLRVIDLGGRTVIPGLVSTGDEWQVGDAGSWRAAYALGYTSVAARAEQGRGYLQRRFTGESDTLAASGETPPSPWPAIQAGVTEKMERLEALRLFTPDGSGSIEVGRRADLVVLSDDLLAVPEEEIGSLSSVLTLVGGKVVFESNLLSQ